MNAQQLPRQQKKILFLLEKGYTVGQIVASTGITRQSVQNQISRIKQKGFLKEARS